MKKETTLQLANRLNAIIKETNELQIKSQKIDDRICELNKEWDTIVYELWERIPSLTDDVNLRPKTDDVYIRRKNV